jgi:hypothetical protein
MAILQNPLIGRARRKLGNTVFQTLYGQNILKSKPLTVKNPKTPAQVLVRDRWSKLTKLIKQVTNYINTAYAGSVQGMTVFAYVSGINAKNCFIDNSSDIDPTLLKLCDHDGSFVDNVVLTSTVANTITGTFNSRAQNVDEGTDPVKAYGFYADGNQIWQFDQTAVRNTGTITLTRPGMSAINIAVYFECLDRLSLINNKPKHVIKYVGTITVL